MHWYVFIENCGLVFVCPDDTEGEENVIEFLTGEMPRDFGVDTDDEDYWIVRGEEKTFAPPSSKGKLV